MEKNELKKWPTALYCLALILAFVLLTLFIMALCGVVLVNMDLYYIPAALFIVIGIAAMVVSKKVNPKYRKAGSVILVLSIIAVVLATGIYSVWGRMLFHRSAFFYSSPNGENQIVVYDNGFIDSVVHAAPSNGLFYARQNNGKLAYHNMWGLSGGSIVVEWISENEAVVRIETTFPPEKDSNETDEIVVRF